MVGLVMVVRSDVVLVEASGAMIVSAAARSKRFATKGGSTVGKNATHKS